MPKCAPTPKKLEAVRTLIVLRGESRQEFHSTLSSQLSCYKLFSASAALAFSSLNLCYHPPLLFLCLLPSLPSNKKKGRKANNFPSQQQLFFPYFLLTCACLLLPFRCVFIYCACQKHVLIRLRKAGVVSIKFPSRLGLRLNAASADRTSNCILP